MAPPAAGPTLRIRLKPTEFSETAADSSSLVTISPIEACHDGLCRAVPQPIRKVKPSKSQGVSISCIAISARPIETTSMKLCAISITRRRSKLSAKTPASSEKIMIGSVTEA
jgi:hypothetical protein